MVENIFRILCKGTRIQARNFLASKQIRNETATIVFCHLQQIECNFDVCRERLRVQFTIMNSIRNLIRNWFHFNGLQRFGFT